MIAILIFISVLIGLNIIPELINKELPKTQKRILKILIISTLFFLALTIMSFMGYWLKSLFLNLIIKFIFILTSFIYFVTVQNTRRKLITSLLIIPLIIFSFCSMILSKTVYSYKVNNDLNILVTSEGFLACGEIIRLTKTEFGIFEKELIYDSNQCLRGIKKIETVRFNKYEAEFLIYHNGEMDSENPYNYKIENKKNW
jgi:hypothetical protein